MTDFEKFNSVLIYQAETGRLMWRCDLGRNKTAGREAGAVRVAKHTFYRCLSLHKKDYLAHRVVWLLSTGTWPANDIDHIDGDGLNNRFTNLRDVVDSENCKNARQRRDNTSGITGVHWNKRTLKWHAAIGVDGKSRHIGVFDKIEDAAAARKAANEQFGFSERHGTIS